MQIFSAIIALFKAISLFDKWAKIVMRLFRKDPVKQEKELEKEHENAAKKAENNDDTSGSFGG